MTTVQVVASISEAIKEKKKLKCQRSSLPSPGHRSTGIKMPILRCMARFENKQTNKKFDNQTTATNLENEKTNVFSGRGKPR